MARKKKGWTELRNREINRRINLAEKKGTRKGREEDASGQSFSLTADME